MSETAFICTKCRHSFSMLAAGAQSISCPGCGQHYEFPALQTVDGRAIRVTERLAGAEKELSAIQIQNEELKRSLESSKHRASDRRLMVADQQRKLNTLQQDKVKLQQEIERLKRAPVSAAPTPTPAPDLHTKDHEIELKKARNELQLSKVESLRLQGLISTLTSERDDFRQRVHAMEVSLADVRQDIASASLSAESEKLKVFEEHLAQVQTNLASAESERSMLREKIGHLECEHASQLESRDSELSELRQTSEQLRQSQAETESNLAKIEVELQENRRAKEQAEADSRSSAEVMELLNQDLQNLQEEHRKLFEQSGFLRQQIQSTELSLASARANYENAQAQIRTLREDRDAATSAATSLRSDMTQALEEAERLKREIAEANLSLEKAESLNRQMREELNSKVARAKTEEGDTPENFELKTENEQIRNTLVETRIELLKIKEQSVLSQSRASALQAELITREKELGTARGELANSDREYDRVSEQYQEVKQHYMLVNQKLDASRREIETLKDQLSEMTSRFEEAQKQEPEPPEEPEPVTQEPVVKNPPGSFFKTFRLTGKKD